MKQLELSNLLKKSAFQFGFDLVRISLAEPLEEDRKRYHEWLQKGYAADLHYMLRDVPRRWVPQDLFPEAKSVITLAVNFFSGASKMEPKRGFGRVARYAWGKDYHSVIRKRLTEWVKLLPDLIGQPVKTKILVDSSPLLERAFASLSGIGFVGKNTVIISRKLGSFIFLSEVLTDIELQEDPIRSDPFPLKDDCGSCQQCIRGCPTGALVSPRQLDARKCISYWTIENRGEIPEEIRSQIGDWIFGCDLCQDLCPYNGLSQETQWREFFPESGTGPYLSLLEVLSIKTEEEFKRKFVETPLLRAKRSGLVRNACVVAANQRFGEAIPLLKELSQRDSEQTVRTHALWSLNQIDSS